MWKMVQSIQSVFAAKLEVPNEFGPSESMKKMMMSSVMLKEINNCDDTESLETKEEQAKSSKLKGISDQKKNLAINPSLHTEEEISSLANIKEILNNQNVKPKEPSLGDINIFLSNNPIDHKIVNSGLSNIKENVSFTEIDPVSNQPEKVELTNVPKMMSIPEEMLKTNTTIDDFECMHIYNKFQPQFNYDVVIMIANKVNFTKLKRLKILKRIKQMKKKTKITRNDSSKTTTLNPPVPEFQSRRKSVFSKNELLNFGEKN